jgi:phospholipase/lecithinase/hemolysin
VKKLTITSVAVAVLLSACGGSGGGSSNNNTSVKSVKVVGASLSDSGTFGYKFTVQPGSTYKVYSELIAASYGMTKFCPAYASSDGTTFVAGASGCTNYAVAGAKVNNYVSGATPTEDNPASIIKQLSDVGTAGFTANDLLIVGEASSNDAAALALAYGTPGFAALLGSLLNSATLTTYATDPATLGTLYMRALADKLVVAVETNALAKGAPRVAIVNTLDITKTPRFTKALADLSAALGSAAAAQFQALVQAWVRAYNTELTTRVTASSYASKMVVVDMYAGFNSEMGPEGLSTYGLINTTDPVCYEVVAALPGGTTLTPGTTSLSDPTVLAACTGTAAAALNLNSTTNGWEKYLFADSFHPTPYGHQLLSMVYFQAFTAKNWN